jgi:hypothetical protein
MAIRCVRAALYLLLLSGCGKDVSCPDGPLVSVHALDASSAAWDSTKVESGTGGFCNIVPTEP